MSGRLRKHQRQILHDCRRVAEAHGGSVDLVGNTWHAKLVCQCRGKTRITPVAGTPTDRDTTRRLKLQDVKRIFREMSRP